MEIRLVITLILLLKIGVHLQCFFQSDAEYVRHHLCQHVTLCIRHVERPSYITDHTFREHGSESNYLHDFLMTIFAAHIFNDLAPALRAEIT